MAGKRNDKGAKAAGGTLQDEAASGGDGNFSFGSMIMGDFNGGGKEEGGQKGEDEISSNFIPGGSQGTSVVSGILARRVGDDKVFGDGEGAARTVYQQRILDSAKAARTQYLEAQDREDAAGVLKHGEMLLRFVDALMGEGLSESPEVRELISKEELDEISVMLGAKFLANNPKKDGEEPTSVMDSGSISAALSAAVDDERDLGREIDRELEEVGIETLEPDSPASTEVDSPLGDGQIPEGNEELEIDYEREVVEETPIGEAEASDTDAAPFEQPGSVHAHPTAEKADIVADPPPLPKRKEAKDASIDGRAADRPQPVSDESNRELEKISAGGLLLTPLGGKERKTLAKLDELSPEELRGMAAKRRACADIAFSIGRPATTKLGSWYSDFLLKLKKEGLGPRENLSALTTAKMELIIQADQLDMLAAKRELAAKEEPAAKLGGTQNIASRAAGSDESQAGLGVGEKQGGGAGSKGSLSRTDLFGPFDEEIAQFAGEGSGPLDVKHIKGMSGAKELPKDPALERIPTGQLKAAKGLASLESTGITGPEEANERLREAQRKTAEEEAAGRSLGGTSVAVSEAIAGLDGNMKAWGEEAFAETRVSSPADALEGAGEDFSIYGDIFYAVEKVYMESSGIPAELDELGNFAKLLPDAIKKAEGLVSDKSKKAKKGETPFTNAEEMRVARLEKFKADFFDIPKGKDAPKKNFLAYTGWLAGKKREYSQASDVHELLGKALAGDLSGENKHGVSPGEYNRVAVMRLCNAAIKKGTLTEKEEERVEKLREMLEPMARGEHDIYAQTIAADATYEMIVGFATKQERARMRQLEGELGKYKITAEEYEAKREMMAKVLAEALVSVRGSEQDFGKAKEKIKQAIMALAPDDPFEREKYIKLINDAQDGAGGKPGEELRAAAENVAALLDNLPPDTPISVTPLRKPVEQCTPDELRMLLRSGQEKRPQAQAVPVERALPKQHGPVAKSIGTAITMAVGAGVLAAGLWLGQNGMITFGSRADNAAERPVAAQVENFAEESPMELPAGIVDSGKASANKDAGDGAAASQVGKRDAGAKADSGVARDAGAVPLVKAAGETQPEQPPEVIKDYTRDKAGLKEALDDWCKEEHGLLVSGEMLRASYAAVEGRLSGKVLPHEADWVPLMLKMKFPNRVIELSVMSDLARSDLDSVEKYSALMRLSIVLGDRAGNPKSFPVTIKEAKSKGISLPPLDKESHMGKIEGAMTGERCLFAAYHETVTVRMAQIKREAVESGMSEKEFKKAVSGVLGGNAKRIMKLYEFANGQANHEEREGACRALTGGKRGAAALERALEFVLPKWEASYKRAKARAERHQKEADTIIGPAPEGTNAMKIEGKTEKKKSPCAGKQGLNFFSCVNELNEKRLMEAAEKDRKRMHAPKKDRDAGSASKASFMNVRY